MTRVIFINEAAVPTFIITVMIQLFISVYM